jgi:hypothetical protein
VAIAGWHQKILASGTVTFTSPTGWTRLVDSGAITDFNHSDLEYLINPGLPFTPPTLTSSGTTNPLSIGGLVVLKAAHPIEDMTAFIRY